MSTGEFTEFTQAGKLQEQIFRDFPRDFSANGTERKRKQTLKKTFHLLERHLY